MKVYVVTHNWVSHDMFVSLAAKIGNPKVIGIFSTREKAKKHIRPDADDYITVFTLDKVKK